MHTHSSSGSALLRVLTAAKAIGVGLLTAIVIGQFSPGAALASTSLNGTGYSALSSARLLDTRPDGSTVDDLFARGGLVGPDSAVDVTVTGRGGVPASGVGAVVLNVTAVGQSSRTFITV